MKYVYTYERWTLRDGGVLERNQDGVFFLNGLLIDKSDGKKILVSEVDYCPEDREWMRIHNIDQ